MYKQNKNREDYKVVVPLEDGTFSEIEHLNIDTPTKTLGLMTAPTGSNAGVIKQMKDKAEAWLSQAKLENSINEMTGFSWTTNSGLLKLGMELAQSQPPFKN
jgi:hypothetical protein